MLTFVHRHRRILLAQLPLAVLSVALLLWRVDVVEALRRIPDVNIGWAAAGLLIFTASKAIHAYRWRVLLGHRDVPLRPLFGIFLFSNLANALVPLRAGDLVRVELPSRLLRLPRAELASNVFIVETMFDGLAFVLLVVLPAFLLGNAVLALPGVTLFVVLVLVAFAGVAALARVQIPENPEQTVLVRRLPRRWRAAAGKIARQFIAGMTSLRDGRRAAFALLVSLVAWLAEVLVYWMMGQAFGVEVDFGEAVVLMVAANLVVSLPLTPWDIGPYEVAVTEALVLLGGDRAEASSYAVGSHLLLLSWITITGVAAMFTLSLRPRDALPRPRPAEKSGERSAPG